MSIEISFSMASKSILLTDVSCLVSRTSEYLDWKGFLQIMAMSPLFGKIDRSKGSNNQILKSFPLVLSIIKNEPYVATVQIFEHFY